MTCSIAYSSGKNAEHSLVWAYYVSANNPNDHLIASNSIEISYSIEADICYVAVWLNWRQRRENPASPTIQTIAVLDAIKWTR